MGGALREARSARGRRRWRPAAIGLAAQRQRPEGAGRSAAFSSGPDRVGLTRDARTPRRARPDARISPRPSCSNQENLSAGRQEGVERCHARAFSTAPAKAAQWTRTRFPSGRRTRWASTAGGRGPGGSRSRRRRSRPGPGAPASRRRSGSRRPRSRANSTWFRPCVSRNSRSRSANA
jgi:hypothetical protein